MLPMNLLVRVADWTNRARVAHFRCRDLARICGVCPEYLNQYFVANFHRPPQEWLDELRMWEAFRMLCEGCSSKECSYTLGFKQVSHFSRVFTLYHGFSPSHCAEIYRSHERVALRQLRSKFWDVLDVKAMLPPPYWIQAENALALKGKRSKWTSSKIAGRI